MDNRNKSVNSIVQRVDQMIFELIDIKKDLLKLKDADYINDTTKDHEQNVQKNVVCKTLLENAIPQDKGVQVENCNVGQKSQEQNCVEGKKFEASVLCSNNLNTKDQDIQTEECTSTSKRSDVDVKAESGKIIFNNIKTNRNEEYKDSAVNKLQEPTGIELQNHASEEVKDETHKKNTRVNSSFHRRQKEYLSKRTTKYGKTDNKTDGQNVTEIKKTGNNEFQGPLVNKLQELDIAESLNSEIKEPENKASKCHTKGGKYGDLLDKAPVIPGLRYNPMRPTEFLNVLETHLDKKSKAYQQVQYWQRKQITNQWFVLDRGAQEGHIDLITVFLKNGLTVDEDVGFGHTMLHSAAMGGQVSLVDLLLSLGADIESRTMSDWWTPLHCAARYGWTKVVKLLIQRGADVNVKDETNSTPLHWGAENGHLAVVQALVDNKCDKNIQNSSGKTAWHLACEKNHSSVVNILKQK